MIKFGVVNIDVSHPLAFAEALSADGRGRYAAVYNDGFRREDEVKAFSKKFDLKICNTVEELADYADVGMVQGCNWDKHLSYAQPFIDRNKPVFIDKPIVGNLKDCRSLIELSKKGANILGTSALRYCDEVTRVQKALKEKELVPLHLDITVGVDEFNYAIHAIEAMTAIITAPPKSARYISTATVNGKRMESYVITFSNGSTAYYHNALDRFLMFNTVVITADPSEDFLFSVDNTKLYRPMLDEILNAVEGKENRLATVQQMVTSVKIALACKASKENGGKEICMDDAILEDTYFDGYEFEKEYAQRATKIYI